MSGCFDHHLGWDEVSRYEVHGIVIGALGLGVLPRSDMKISTLHVLCSHSFVPERDCRSSRASVRGTLTEGQQVP